MAIGTRFFCAKGLMHHLCGLALECESQLFQTDFTIRRDDDTRWLAVDLNHEGLQEAPRLYAESLRSLQTDAFCVGIVVVTVEREIDANLIQRNSAARTL